MAQPPRGTRGDKTLPAFSGSSRGGSPDGLGMLCRAVLLLLPLFSFDSRLSLILVPVLIAALLPPHPWCMSGLLDSLSPHCRWLSSARSDFSAW